MSNTASPSGNPVSVAEALLETLEEEQEGLVRLRDYFGKQLQALRDQQAGQLQQVTLQVSEETHSLDRLYGLRRQQMGLLAQALDGEASESPLSLKDLADRLYCVAGGQGVSRRLLEARMSVIEEAECAQHRREELAFAIEYTAKLGWEMLQVLKDLKVMPPASFADGDLSQNDSLHHIIDKLQ